METTENLLTRDSIIGFLHPDPESEELRSVEKELLNGIEPAGIFMAYKEDMDDMKKCRKMLKEMKASYDPEKHDRAYVEHHYLLLTDILFHMARRFHPLSENGKNLLKEAVEYRKEFEKEHGTLVSSITKRNAEQFSDVLSKDIIDEIEHGKCRGIGALRTDEKGTFAAGALCYYLENDPADNEPVLRVKWLYVDEDYRYTGVAGSLIGEMVYQMTLNDEISAMTLDYPCLLPESEILGNLLQEWHFSFMTGLAPEFICRVSDIKNRDELGKYSGRANSMEALTDRDLKVKGHPEGTFDRELSYFTGDIKNPDSILLGYRSPSGILRVEYFHCRPGSEKNLLFPLTAFLLNAVNKYEEDTEIVIPVESLEVGEVLDKLVPVQKTDPIVEGILMRPSEEEDLTTSEVNHLIRTLDKK